LLIDTLESSRRVDSECETVEGMSGEGAMASPRQAEKSPQELKAQEGIEWLAGLIRLPAATDRCSDQRPEGEVSGNGSGGATRREKKLANDTRARLVDETSRLGSGKNP
jgi:hypothetical protein